MRSAFLLAALLAVLPYAAAAQDKRLEAVCGELFGARQTAIRLMQEGWARNLIVQDALDRSEWRAASMQDKKLLLDLLQETFDDPRSPSSAVIRDCMRRATAAPKAG